MEKCFVCKGFIPGAPVLARPRYDANSMFLHHVVDDDHYICEKCRDIFYYAYQKAESAAIEKFKEIFNSTILTPMELFAKLVKDVDDTPSDDIFIRLTRSTVLW